MDLDHHEALKMVLREIEGDVYLFVETGGFGTRNVPAWKTPLHVMMRNRDR